MKIVEDFEAAVRADEMKGAAHPQDHEAIEANYKLAKERLVAKLREHHLKLARAH